MAPVGDGVVAGGLPDHPGLAVYVLDVDVEVDAVAAGGGVGDAGAVGREAAGVVDGFGVAGEVAFFAVR